LRMLKPRIREWSISSSLNHPSATKTVSPGTWDSDHTSIMYQGRIGGIYLITNEWTVLAVCGTKTRNINITLIEWPNGSDAPCSDPTRTAVRTARCSFYLRPFSPANTVYSMYRDSTTTIFGRGSHRTLLQTDSARCGGWRTKGKRGTLIYVSAMRRGGLVGAG